MTIPGPCVILGSSAISWLLLFVRRLLPIIRYSDGSILGYRTPKAARTVRIFWAADRVYAAKDQTAGKIRTGSYASSSPRAGSFHFFGDPA